MIKIKQFFANLLSTLWFVPTLIIFGAVALAFGAIEFDRWQGDSLAKRWPRLIGTDSEGAREMLSVIAGSMITVAGVAFSITIVALAQTASQYSSRVLRNFMRNTSNQVVLGALAGIFAYCLVVLRNVTGGTDSDFLPGLAVALGSVIALIGVLFLIYFLHHVASSIQAANIAAEIAGDTIEVVHRLFADGENSDDQPADGNAEGENTDGWAEVRSGGDGYVQRIDRESLLRLARKEDLAIAIRVGVGEFIVKGAPVAALSKEFEFPEECVCSINRCFVLGPSRTLDQDPLFGMRQIADIAVKALSPGVNDPTTACVCINYITAILCRVAASPLEPAAVWDRDKLRLLGGNCTFDKFAILAFEEIVSCSSGQPNVLAHLLRAVERVNAAAKSANRRWVLLQQLDSIDKLIDRIEIVPARNRLHRQAFALRMSLSDGTRPAILQTEDEPPVPII